MSNSESELFILVDGNALVHRAYHGIKTGLSTSDGRPTTATYSFTRSFQKVINAYEPKYMAVCFDRGRSKREEIYSEYKAGRKETPDELALQFDDIREIIKAYGITIVQKEGYEADDVIATLTEKAVDSGLEVMSVTIDKDMLQLVSPNVSIYRLGLRRENETIYDEDKVKEKYGVEPNFIPDYLALTGDKVDNIPGVYGIGKKTAPKLINELGTVEQILQNIDEVPSRYRNKLEESKEDAKMSKQLATLQTDIELSVEIEDCRVGEKDEARIFELFDKLEFNSLIDKDEDLERPKNRDKYDYKTVLNEEEFDSLLEELISAEEFAVDLETDSLDTMKATIVGISFSLIPDSGYYVPINHRYLDVPNTLSEEYVLEKLKPILIEPKYGKIGQNIKFDLKILKCHDIEMKGISFDTMIASYLLHPTESEHNLDRLVRTYLNRSITPIEEIIGSGSNKITMDEAPVEQVSYYACEDADCTLQLKNKFAPEIEAEELDNLFYNVEIPLIPVLADMELTGIKVDTEYLSQLSKEFGIHLNKMREEIYELAGEQFNIRSPKQLSHILFEKLELPKSRRTKTGYSTNVRVLESLSDKHPLPEKILEYRQFAKLKSTYVDALKEIVSEDTKRIHTSFQQAITRTGRLSSREPNLQNIPIRTEEGRRIRRAFIADEGKLLLSADYSQIELRVLAHLSSDENLVEAFQNDIDIHSQAASLIFDVPVDEVESYMRNQAKTMNYGIIYGIGANRLANELKIDYSEAQNLIDEYFETYQGVKEYFNRTVEKAEKNGYVETLFGRRCYVPEVQKENYRQHEFGKRAAINAPVQGTAADLIKIAMLRIYDYLSSSNKETKMLLQVHDELVFEVPDYELSEVESKIRDLMENVFSFDVPIKVDIGTGKNWLEAK